MKKNLTPNKHKNSRFFKFSYLMLTGLLSCFIAIIIVPIVLTNIKKEQYTKNTIKEGTIDAQNLNDLKIELPKEINNEIEFKSQPVDLINTSQVYKLKSNIANDFENIFKYTLIPYFKGTNIEKEFKNVLFNEPKNKEEFQNKIEKIKSVNNIEINKEVDSIISSLQKTSNDDNSKHIQNPINGVYTHTNIKKHQEFEIDITNFILNYKDDKLFLLDKFLELVDHFSFDAIYVNIQSLDYYKFNDLILKNYFDKLNNVISSTKLNNLKIKQFKFLISIDIDNNEIQHLLFEPKLIAQKV
ncbi:hypothetical protein [Mycoplasma miroungirhinis]|uniref:Lipoprotein n=1 Tax=Mycoplasma miroungirhinis TaxID=754516 RepID=A0A6M4JB44_9MOLU|nr:hypothetical protein [Mycoplasma miroungirhinis]QJR44213.1 hypothetical protein HLA92_02080 [Mycoplasma miroungirhinis]